MLDHLTQTAGQAFFFARFAATELGGEAVEAEHLLLGLLRADRGSTPSAFAAAKLSYTEARATIREHWGARQHLPASEGLPASEAIGRILEYAAEEVDRMGQRSVTAGHLLLGVLRDDGSFAAGLLKSHGMTVDGLREHIAKPSAVPELEPEAPPAGAALAIKREAFDAVVALERIRSLAEILGQPETRGGDGHLLVDEIHHHCDALKQHMALKRSTTSG